MQRTFSHWARPEKVVFALFACWLALALLLAILHLAPEAVPGWGLPEWVATVLTMALRYADPLLILVAAANTHLMTARHWGAHAARRWGGICLGTSLAVEILGSITGQPFGAFHYTENFGPLIFGTAPFVMPLLSFVIITNLLFLARQSAPGLLRNMEAAVIALGVAAVDFLLEPYAAGVKQYWIWDSGAAPIQNYLAWLGLAYLLIRLAAPTASLRPGLEPRPLLIISGLVVLFVLGRVAG